MIYFKLAVYTYNWMSIKCEYISVIVYIKIILHYNI